MTTQNPFTTELLANIGVELDTQTKEQLSEHLLETLHDRVGVTITTLLDDDQLVEYVRLTNGGGNDSELSQWLSATIPDFAEIVRDELDILLGEVADSVDNIPE